MSDQGENMIIGALDQDWESCVDAYENLCPADRGELALWLTGRRGDIKTAPPFVKGWIIALASTALLETGLRWAQRNNQ